ncbi:MAG: PEP-CTERM sorting domain-containing protein [Pseudomonadales bacterium]|nr:PEP-CTERM sorting domain-containing protein [Pseudomonadales bacterium]
MKHTLALGAALALASTSSLAAPISADVVFLVDESGSMAGEHTWLGNMISSLESGLQAKGVGGSQANQYSLVGFGSSLHGTGQAPHPHDMDAGTGGIQNWGSAAQFATATSSLVASGGFEDGWSAIDWAINNLSFRSDSAVNFVLVTDEDRDAPFGDTLTANGLLSDMGGLGALLNVVVNNNFGCSPSTTGAIGIDSDNNGYEADGSGGYTECAGQGTIGSGFGTTKTDYVDLATATGGAAWNLNILRSGGLDADSFTQSFVDIKVEEITNQDPNDPGDPVPEPGSLALFGLGLTGLYLRRRRTQA